jgi:endonuclease YncB( thermonuclease family)
VAGWASRAKPHTRGVLAAQLIDAKTHPCAFVAAAVPCEAQTITDGDTIKQGGAIYRLWGIDAPEIKQDCPDGWPAGRMATTRLRELTAGQPLVCQPKTTDRYGRTVAICRASGEDLGALMVRQGMAWAFIRDCSLQPVRLQILDHDGGPALVLAGALLCFPQGIERKHRCSVHEIEVLVHGWPSALLYLPMATRSNKPTG